MGIKKQPGLYKNLWSYNTSSFLLEAKFEEKKIGRPNFLLWNAFFMTKFAQYLYKMFEYTEYAKTEQSSRKS